MTLIDIITIAAIVRMINMFRNKALMIILEQKQ